MREKILDAAEEIVQNKGLDAVSFQQLADAVGLSKASVFHHFRNTEALALALVGRCRSKYGEEYASIAGRNISAHKKLKEIAASFEAGLRNNRLCLLAALGSSQPTLSESMRGDSCSNFSTGTRRRLLSI
jgi:TetR/AcrR family transcriptional repressor of nem operon